MSLYNLIESNNLNLLSESQTIKKINISNSTDGNSYTQLIQNKNGIIALNSDVDSISDYYASLTVDTSLFVVVGLPSTKLLTLMPLTGNGNAVEISSNFTSVQESSYYVGWKYNGLINKKFIIILSAGINSDNGKDCTLNLYKNGIPTTFFTICNAPINLPLLESINNVFLSCIIELANNDVLSIYQKSAVNQTLNIYSTSFKILPL